MVHTAIHKQEASEVWRPYDLPLIHLPEHTRLLPQLPCLRSLLLPTLAVPVLIATKLHHTFPVYSREIHERIVFCMAVGIDTIAVPQSTNVTVPGLSVAVPPVP